MSEKKEIIHIYGASGSGTSTLGKKICKEFGERTELGGDMYQQHTDFLEWARLHDTGDRQTTWIFSSFSL